MKRARIVLYLLFVLTAVLTGAVAANYTGVVPADADVAPDATECPAMKQKCPAMENSCPALGKSVDAASMV